MKMVLSKSQTHNIRRARNLSASDYWTLIEAWLSLAYFYSALRYVSYQKLQSSYSMEVPENTVNQMKKARHIHRLIRFAARIQPLPASCLTKSLALQAMLKRRNIPAQIHIGIHPDTSAFSAHAWVEVNGKSLGEKETALQSFHRLEYHS